MLLLSVVTCREGSLRARREEAVTAKGFFLLVSCLACSAGALFGAPPEITGGDYLSESAGVNEQVVPAYTTTDPYAVTIYDPDPDGLVSLSITIGGPLGGVKGGSDGMLIPSGSPRRSIESHRSFRIEA